MATTLIEQKRLLYRTVLGLTEVQAMGLSLTDLEVQWLTSANVLKGASQLRRWKMALAGRSAAGANVLILGDSFVAKNSSGDPNSIRWVNRLRLLLQAQYNTGGVGGRGYLPMRGATVDGGSPWTFTGALGASAVTGIGRIAYSMSAAATASITVTCDRFELHYHGYSGSGTVNVQIDGGAAVPLATSQATVKGYVYDSGAIALASHTILITWVSNGTIFLGGLTAYNGDFASGVRVFEGGTSGTQANYLIGGNANEQWNMMALVKPDLLILEFGSNEMAASYSPTSFKQDLINIVAKVTAGNDAGQGGSTYAPSVCLMPVWAASFAPYTDATWAPYRRAILDVAAEQGWAVADIYDIAGFIGSDPYALTAGGDFTHPSAKGNQLIADTIFRAITT